MSSIVLIGYLFLLLIFMRYTPEVFINFFSFKKEFHMQNIIDLWLIWMKCQWKSKNNYHRDTIMKMISERFTITTTTTMKYQTTRKKQKHWIWILYILLCVRIELNEWKSFFQKPTSQNEEKKTRPNDD